MSNNYFQFKQFKIIQDRTAMKVGTDGVLLGAWVDIGDATSVLDIGTGTGLIAIMMAQRYQKANIDALEIESDAYRQACENVANCLWKDRLQVIHASFQKFSEETSKKYDLIISNPPFFTNLSSSNDVKRAGARHNTTLSLDELLAGVVKILAPKGRFCLILPVSESEIFIQKASNKSLFCSKISFVKSTLLKDPKRLLLEFSFVKQSKPNTNTIVIEKEKRHDYTDEYKDLSKDFYLNF